ncbi:MAG TPA: YdcF family protein, partial [Pyrinomonadaceae bacterium]|nr:YdcF family protein [Pyrinomonadaceae bacterium]
RLLVAAVALAAAWPVAAWAAARALVERAGLERADALVVLSGSAAYVERTRRAAELYREGRAPRVVLTDDGQRGPWSEAERRNPLFVERARGELIRAGVPAEGVEVLPQPVAGTYDEALAARAYAERAGARSLLFVTSAYHSRRALWAARRAFRGSGVRVGVEPVEPGGQTPTPASWWWQARGWRAVALEYPKLVYYYLKYG